MSEPLTDEELNILARLARDLDPEDLGHRAVKELRERRVENFKITLDAADAMSELRAENTKLREYVRHKGDCETWYPVDVEAPDGKTGPCTCGLDDALKEPDDE